MYTRYQSGYIAHALSLEGIKERALTRTIASARVDMNPHQVIEQAELKLSIYAASREKNGLVARFDVEDEV
ncbi:hypothetical protein FACS1894116_13920 [Betaproteobacteria bacterium]|nr:hypothetical protein FACS1894116_13920 [Betaproteobacteria bacterium]GHU23457.1 hypothetical protein FACS189488_06070 [Betaproteobacteria bacterium]GHU30748.1 hypothetical protein FACS189497_10850 [Betaproteobacteria bacterium]